MMIKQGKCFPFAWAAQLYNTLNPRLRIFTAKMDENICFRFMEYERLNQIMKLDPSILCK